jgi:ribonuclease T2
LGIWPVLAGLLLAASISGCKGVPQPPATVQPSAADGQQRAPGAEYAEDARPGPRRSRRGKADSQAAPGTFDFYLLNLSWSPEFCATHQASPECGRGLGFVVHGLWPQDASGDYPEDCSDAPGPANPQAFTDLIPTPSLVEHEWQTHGTCSGLSADAYFSAVRRAFAAVRIPSDIGAGNDADGVAPEQLLQRFATANPSFPDGSIALSCGNNRLTAIEVCLTRDLQPESCQGVRSCRANSVKVTPK